MVLFGLLLAAGVFPAAGQGGRVLVYNAQNAAHRDTGKIMTLDIRKDFGAIGNGNSDDQPAFDAASAFINARGGFCKLVIPQGTYRVGRQVSNQAGRYMSGQNVLNIGVVGGGYKNKVEIAGVGAAVLKYKDNMRYGYFSQAGQAMNIAAARNVDVLTEAATLGKCIYIFNAGNIKISNLVLDGNFYPGKMKLGGRHMAASQGIQQEHYGIYIDYSENVTVNNVTVRRFGLDGFLIFNASSIRKNVRIENCLADYNGRQGMSILFADGVYVTNCKFTNTGMGELRYSGLQAGVDLEPEHGNAVIENVFFKNCTFSQSRNSAVVISAGAGNVRNIFFEKCNIINVNSDGNSIALDLGKHKGINFTNCNIYGYVLIASSGAASKKEGYNFTRCSFSDCYPGSGLQLPMTSTNLIYPPGGKQTWDYVSMDNCTFDIYGKRPWSYLNSVANKMSSISNSIIYVNGTNDVIKGGDDVIAQDENINLVNNKFYLYNNQKYVHGGKAVAPANSNAAVNWNGNTFARWNAAFPARVCPTKALRSKR